ncbi:MAG: DUF370 domain-containing protein [Oscillospiraceae bacterium]|jgi:hypothetical protein|nr:DUF370 domain-containing protein [Oscillospiraceae bacterium]
MYLALGGAVVRQRDILGIFDLDAVTVSHITRDFLRAAQERGQVRDAGGGYDLPKSFVLMDGGLWLSPLNSATLQKRCNSFSGML